MAQFTPLNIDPNANGSYFSMQLRGGEEDLDIFAVFGLPADGDELDLGALRSFFRTQLVKHVAVGTACRHRAHSRPGDSVETSI